MISAEMQEIRRILNGKYKICQTMDETERWFYQLKEFDFVTVKEAINDWIINDGWKPEVVNIVERCKDVQRWKKQLQAAGQPAAERYRKTRELT